MNKTFKVARLLAAAAVLAFASMSASAGIINFSFLNTGYVSGAGSCGYGCSLVQTTGTATELGGIPGVNEKWSFHGVMQFYQGSDAGVGLGTSWSFKDLDGSNDLYGTFATLVDGGLSDILRPGEVLYTITGGSGLFAGATGGGLSSITYLLSTLFTEVGSMTVYTKSISTPEPAVSMLMLVGIGMLGFMAYRRRRAMNQL
jgi:PEP-CTERM motif-containing protein